MNKKIFLLDGMALIYRAYFGFIRRPVINTKGVNTSAMLGFANSLLDLLYNHEATHLAVCFDLPEPTFRHKMYPEYKAQREKAPDDLVDSIEPVKQLVQAMNIPMITLAGYEADDLIGTLANRFSAENDAEIYMVTPDKDFGQLVRDNVFLMRPGHLSNRLDVLDCQAICDRWDIERVEQVIDILALAGDVSDNIPGVPGVGPKTAAKLIKLYDSVEGIIEHVGDLKGKQKERLEENAELAVLSKKLVTIELEVPIDVPLESLACSEPDAARLAPLLEEFELKAIAKRVLGTAAIKPVSNGPQQGDLFAPAAAPVAQTEVDNPAAPAAQGELFDFSGDVPVAIQPQQRTLDDVPHDYTLLTSKTEVGDLIASLTGTQALCVDTETTGLDPLEAELVGVSLCTKAGKACFILVPEDAEAARELVQPLQQLFDSAGLLIGHHLKYDLHLLRRYGLHYSGACFDTMVADYLLDPDQRHKMDNVALRLLDYVPIPIEKLIGENKRQQCPIRETDPDLLRDYAAEDADVTYQLYKKQKTLLVEKELDKIFYTCEMPLVPVLLDMEAEGVRLDTSVLTAVSGSLGEEAETLKLAVINAAGHDFNLNSPKQLGEVLFDELKIVEKPKKTATGQYATGESVLLDLSAEHKIVADLLEYRGVTKLKNTYVDPLPECMKNDGRIHSTFSQTIAATGRLSSSNPNLQNIPIRTERGRNIRKAFVPRNGQYVIAASDYSQIELRIMASLSGDEGMCQAFRDGLDIHTATAARVYGVELADVDRDMRSKAKMVNFGIIYGISAFGLSQRLHIPRKEASGIIEQYFAQYPGVKTFMDKAIADAQQHGYSVTPAGRRRPIRDINSRNGTVRGGAERNAINAPIQGAAADMIKLAMIDVQALLKREQVRSRLVLQVHDELVFDMHKEEVAQLLPLIEEAMSQAMPLDIPVLVESGVGANWLEAHG